MYPGCRNLCYIASVDGPCSAVGRVQFQNISTGCTIVYILACVSKIRSGYYELRSLIVTGFDERIKFHTVTRGSLIRNSKVSDHTTGVCLCISCKVIGHIVSVSCIIFHFYKTSCIGRYKQCTHCRIIGYICEILLVNVRVDHTTCYFNVKCLCNRTIFRSQSDYFGSGGRYSYFTILCDHICVG